ncbi:MAG: ATP-binding protein [Deferribacterales bacterium]
MQDSKRAVLLFVLLSVLTIAAGAAVAVYWYENTKSIYEQRLIEIVRARKDIFISVYARLYEDSPETAAADAIDILRKSFSPTVYKRYSTEFYTASLTGGKFAVLSHSRRDNLDEHSGDFSNVPSDSILAMALSDRSGLTSAMDFTGEKVLAAYDHVDIGNVRYGMVAKIKYIDVISPKTRAVVSSVLMALVIIVGGGLGFYIFSSRRVDRLVKAKKELELYGNIFDSLDEYVAFLDKNMRYLSANKAYLTILDAKPEEIVGKPFGEKMKKNQMDEILSPYFAKALKGSFVAFSGWFSLPGRGETYLDASFLPHIVEGEVQGIVVRASDRTQEAVAKEALIARSRELQRLTSDLEERVHEETAKRMMQEQLFFEQKKFADMGQMINAIAHQWRQPINSVGLYIQLVYESFKDKSLDEDMLENFKTDSIKLIQHMSKTIDDFRSFFNPRSEETSFEVIKAVIDTVSLVEAQLKNVSIDFAVTCRCRERDFEVCNNLLRPPCELPETLVNGFSSEFRQVLMNLVQNAKDVLFDRQGNKKVTIAVSALDENVTVSISDNGGGVPESIKKKIFDPYFTTKPEGKGTGIGLYMSRLIVEEHMGGKISVYNDEAGAVFVIILPRVSPKMKKINPAV